MKIFIPESLNLESLFEIQPPKFAYKIDVFYYLVYYILLNPYYTFNKRTVYVSLCSKGLQNNVHRDYNLYLEHLMQLEIIERLRSKDEGKCDMYRLSYDFLYDKMESYTITDYKTKKKAKKEIVHTPSTLKKYSHLTKFLTDKNLSFEYMAAYYEVQNKFELDRLSKDIEVLRKYHFSLFTIRNFQENYFWIKNNPLKDNRLHTNITNMVKILRKYLKYKGETLFAIDIRNSQPLMLLILIQNLHNKSKNGVVNPKIWEVIQGTIPSNILINLVKSAESLDIIELERYQKLVTDGYLYEYLGDEYLKSHDVTPPYSFKKYDDTTCKSYNVYFDNIRDLMKIKIFEIYFAKSRNTSFSKFFAQLFPTISNLIAEIKKEDYVLLSRLMQQIESYLILERITKDIYTEHGFEQFTIHDCIATRKRNLETLQTEFKKLFFKETGIIPSIEIQDWGKELEQQYIKVS